MRILQIFAPTSIFKFKTESFPPPILLGYTEKVLEEHDILSIDANNYSLFKFDKKTIANKILNELITDTKKFSPEIILISTWSYGVPFVKRYIEEVRKTSKAKIIIGGYNAIYSPEKLLKYAKPDHIFSGRNILELKHIINNIASQPKIIKDKTELDPKQLPLIDFSSFKFKSEPSNFYLLSSYGCLFNCNFCSECKTYKKIKSQNPDQVIKQIQLFKEKFNPKFIYMWDNNISMNKEFSDYFLNNYDGSIPWFTYSRIELMNKSLAKQLSKANCTHVFFGVEHTNSDILKFFNKTTTPATYNDHLWKSLKTLKDNNIIPVISFIVGSPLETKETLSELIHITKKIKHLNPLTEFEISPLIMEIGSNLWEEYKHNKLNIFKAKEPISEYSGFQPFAEDTDEIEFTPQKYLFENKTISNLDFEKMLRLFLSEFNNITK